MSADKDDQATLDWLEVTPAPAAARPRAARRAGGRTRAALVASVALGLLIAPFGIAATGDALREGVRNGTATRETQIIASHDGAATRQSNTGAGLAAVYGCRRQSAECTRHVNLRDGPAAAFVTDGDVPFSVDDNTGRVANLNADKVDGFDAEQLRGQTGPQGPAGARGPQGPQGARGEQGPTGFTASAAQSTGDDAPLLLTNTATDSGVVRATITTTTETRVMAVASGTFENSAASATVTRCQIVEEQPPTFFFGELISQPMIFHVAANSTAPLSVTGAVVLPAGTHRIGLHCTADASGMTFTAGDIVLWAVAT